MKRNDGRTNKQVRPLSLTYNICANAAGSVLISFGQTKVICTAIMQQGVPKFLRGKGAGWLTAEYCMLPGATYMRTTREASTMKRNGRNVEISRLIGRALRSVIDFSKMGERTIYIDCDVIQADGGTRTASITGAFLALKAAQGKWLEKGLIAESILTDEVAAISVGLVDNEVVVDINCREDNNAQADFNFIGTRSGKLIEMQGGVEAAPIEWDLFEKMREGAISGISQIFSVVDEGQQERFVSKKEQLKGMFQGRLR